MPSLSELLEQLDVQRLFGDDLPKPIPYPRQEALRSSPAQPPEQASSGKRINKKKQRRKERRAALAKQHNRASQAVERLGMESGHNKKKKVQQSALAVTTREPIHPEEPQFLQAAKRSVDKKNALVPFVACPELQRYEPQYKALSREQRDYYFYWRDSVRQGKFIASDEGYLQLHVLEVIHLIGFSHAQEAFDHLYALFDNYADTHEFVRVIFPTFLLDMIVYHRLRRNILNFVATMMSRHLIYISSMALMLEAWLKNKELTFSNIPISMLVSLAEYKDFNTGKFFETINAIPEFRQNFMLQRLYQKASEGLETYYLKHEKTSFMKSFQMDEDYDFRRRPFTEQDFYYPVMYVTIASVPALSYNMARDKLMKNSMKYAENLFRKEIKLRGSRQVKLNKKLKGYIETALEPLLEEARAYQRGQEVEKAKQAALEAQRQAEEERRNRPVRKVELDVSKLEQLEQESVHIREQLIQEEETTKQPVTTKAKAKTGKAVAKTEAKTEAKAATPQKVPSQDTPAMPTEWLELHAALNEAQQELLRLIYKQTSNKKLEAFAQKHFSMKDLLIEEVNELAMEWLEDNIIDPYQEPPVIYEEHHAMLEQLLALA